MKILIICDNVSRGGMERRMIALLEGITRWDNTLAKVVVLSERVEYPEIYDLGIEIKLFKRKVKKDPRVFWNVYKYSKGFQPDLIHCWGSMSTIYSIPSARLLKVPLISSNVNDAPKWKHSFHSKLLRAKFCFLFADVVLGNSQAGLKSFDVPKSKGRCIVNGIDISRSKRLKDASEVRTEFGIKTPFVVGMVGGLNSRKDYPTFIKAACLIIEKNPAVTFLIVGNGPLLKINQDSIPEKYIEHILFLGQLQDVDSVINIFDIGVLATNSISHGEGISNAIMEYMLMGKPVIATDGGGTPEIIVDELTGYLVPAYNTEALAEKILYLMNHREEAIKMGMEGKERIHQDFSLKKMVQTFYELYSATLKLPPVNSYSDRFIQ